MPSPIVPSVLSTIVKFAIALSLLSVFPTCLSGLSLFPFSQSSQTLATTMWFQKQFTLPSRSRGSYLITDNVLKELPEIRDYKIGLLNLFVQHTSCGLSLNENWDSDVRADMSDALDRIAPAAGPKGEALYRQYVLHITPYNAVFLT